MDAADGRRAQQALGALAAMFRSMSDRGDELVGFDALSDIRTVLEGGDLNDMLVGHLRASGTALSRLALERRVSVVDAASTTAELLRSRAAADPVGLFGTAPYEDAARAVVSLAGMKQNGRTLNLHEVFPNTADQAQLGMDAAQAFFVVLYVLVVEIAAVHQMTPLGVCQRLSAEVASVTTE